MTRQALYAMGCREYVTHYCLVKSCKEQTFQLNRKAYAKKKRHLINVAHNQISDVPYNEIYLNYIF